MHRFSIVIPYWGEYEKYLPECLECVSKQTYKDYEVIVVNDCSDLPTARNRGIERANGEFILCLDVDDKIDPRYLEKCVEEFDFGADIVYCDAKEFGDHSAECLIPDSFTKEELFQSNRLVACSPFRKKDWNKIGGYDENMKDGYEDWDFWIRMMREDKKFVKIKETLFFYNKHSDSMSADYQNDRNSERLNYLIKKYAHLCNNS